MAHRLKAAYIGYKAVYESKTGALRHNGRVVIVKLRIPAGALINRTAKDMEEYPDLKTRASVAKVLSITTKRTKSNRKVGWSSWEHGFAYRVGATVRPTFAFDKAEYACRSGIHFFLSRERAVNYSL
jgi:hypothetical protein